MPARKPGEKVFWKNLEGIVLGPCKRVFFAHGGTLIFCDSSAPPGERKFKLKRDEAEMLSKILEERNSQKD